MKVTKHTTDDAWCSTLHDPQGALAYQAKGLQENEVIEEENAGGEQRPPHVSQRFRLVDACEQTRFVLIQRIVNADVIPEWTSVPTAGAAPGSQTGFSCALTAFSVWSRGRHQISTNYTG